MKKVLLIVMVVIIFLTGCNENTSRGTTENPDINLSGIPSISDLMETLLPMNTDGQLPEIFESVNLLSIYQRAYTADEKYYDLLGWQEYIYDKFGLEINMFYRQSELKGASAVYYFNSALGYPYRRTHRVFDYTEPETAYDLTPYYEKYNWSSFIDNEYIEALKVNGSIYAVPTASEKYIIPRYYNKAYLDELGMEVPTDINSFHNYLIESKKIMDGEGMLLPMFIPMRQMFQCTADIFRAFGVYVNSESTSMVTYNPNTQSYEDAVFSENIETVLTFIRTLQEQELMSVYGEGNCFNGSFYENPFIGDRFKVNKTFATEYNFVYDKKSNNFRKFLLSETEYEKVSGYYLMNNNSSNVCEVCSDMGFYVFPKNIKNIHGTIDLFNTIMTDGKYYADLLYGVENTNYIIINEEILSKLPDKGTFPGIRLITPFDNPNNYYSPGNTDVLRQLPQESYYEANIFNYIARYDDIINTSISSSFHDNLFMPCISPYDAIEEYKKWFLNSGMKAAIEQLNERIGAVTVYDYSQ